MDKIDGLLAEAKPLYHKRQRGRRFMKASALGLCFAVLFGGAVYRQRFAFDEAALEAYYAALYENEGAFAYAIYEADVLPMDGFGLVEVI